MHLQVIIHEEQAVKIKKLAEEDNRSISSYIRKIILEKIRGDSHAADNAA